MARPPASNNPENIGSYVWCGGEKSELEKETDRFTGERSASPSTWPC
jgi:hypothetical protein